MKYYPHYCGAFDDEKIQLLYMEFGYEGLGLFYTALEKLAAQEKPVKTVVLKKQLRVGKRLEKCWCFMEKIEIIYSNNGETFSKKLANYTESLNEKRKKTSERVSQLREKQKDTESVTHYTTDCNASNINNNITEHNNNITKQTVNSLNIDANRVEVLEDLEEKKEKKKTPPNPAKPPSLHSELRSMIEGMNEGYYWQAKDGTALKSLIKKMTFRWKAKHKSDPADIDLINSFKWILDNLPEFYKNKWDTCLIDSKFEPIIKELTDNNRNGKSDPNKTTPGVSPQLQRVWQRIAERHSGKQP